MPGTVKTSWTVRRASLHDAAALADLCRRSVGPDDYALDYLRPAILCGVMNVVEHRGRIVGMMHCTDTIDGGGWLAMARTDPRYRRTGVARALIENFVGLARNKGRTALRLWTDASNEAGVAAAQAGGWVERARFARMKVEAKGTAKVATVPFTEPLWTRVAASDLVRAGGGYVPYVWHFLRADRPTVFQLCSRRAIVRTPAGTYVRSPDDPDEERGALAIGLLLGTPERTVPGARAVANALGFREAHTYLPLEPRIARAAKASGWEYESWGREAILFEKVLDAPPVRPRRRRTYAEIAAARRSGHAVPGDHPFQLKAHPS